MAREPPPSGKRAQGIVFAIVLLAAVTVILLWYVGGDREEPQAVTAGNTGEPTLVAAMTEPARYWEKAVAGTARVSDVMAPGAVYVEEMGRRVMVLLPADMSSAALETGQKVQIEGMVKPSTQIEPAVAARLSSRALSEVKKDAAYVAATKVAVIE